jgi:phage repressor protein C with HTH and peptisase S24 domain
MDRKKNLHNDIGSRLTIVRGDESLSSFARKLDISRNTLARYEAGDAVPSDILLEICRIKNVRPDWLMLGEGPMRRTEELTPKADLEIIPEGPRKVYIGGDLHRDVPVLAAAPAGAARSVSDADYPAGYGVDGWILVPDPEDANAYALRIDGDSMTPTLVPGDTIIVSPRRREDLRFPICVVRIAGDDITVKYVRYEGTMAYLEPENATYRPIVLPRENIEIIGRVVGWMHTVGG